VVGESTFGRTLIAPSYIGGADRLVASTCAALTLCPCCEINPVTLNCAGIAVELRASLYARHVFNSRSGKPHGNPYGLFNNFP
jgi:hypothetical protein